MWSAPPPIGHVRSGLLGLVIAQVRAQASHREHLFHLDGDGVSGLRNLALGHVELLSSEGAVVNGNGPGLFHCGAGASGRGVVSASMARTQTETSRFSRTTLNGQPCRMPLVAWNSAPTPAPTLNRLRIAA